MKNLIEGLKSNKLVKEEKKTNVFMVVLKVLGVIVVIAAIVYAIYRFFAPNCLEDFEDDFEDEFDDDFFEEDDVVADDVFDE